MSQFIRARRFAVRAGSVVALLAGLTVAVGTGTAGAQPTLAVTPTTWSPVDFTPGVQNNPYDQSLAADASGNLYAIVDGYVTKFNVASGQSTVMAPSSYFECPEGLVADAQGDVFVSYWTGCSYEEVGGIAEISPNGTVTTLNTSSFRLPSYLALAPDGTLYAMDNWGGGIWRVGNAGDSFVAYPPGECWYGFAAGAGGTLYYADGCADYVDVYNGASWSTLYNADAQVGSLAVDSLGNVYMVDDNGEYPSDIKITPSGAATVLSTPAQAPGTPYCTNMNVIGGTTLYLSYSSACSVDPPANYYVFQTTLNSGAAPTQFTVTTADETVNGTRDQTITGNWLGVAGATGYTCTLMYGFDNPSSFTVTTRDLTCTFSGLGLTTEYGIQLVANFGASPSSPEEQFAAPPKLPPPPAPVKTTIECESNKHHHLKSVTAVHPACGRGWHRIG